ncbi:MAG: Flp pilus assembly protein CpaB [Eubacterium sp.]|nr:Flp pilus assembly protein CpaB [Eubacterium sp.]
MKKIYIIAIVSAAICAILLFSYLQNYEKRGASGSIEAQIANEEIVDVVVAKGEIPENTPITKEMLEIKKVPKSAANPDAFSSVNAVVGKLNNVKILNQEQVLRAKVYDEKTGNSDSLALAMASDRNGDGIDTRAITLEVDLEQSVGGFIQKGDRVDVLAAPKGQKPEGVEGRDDKDLKKNVFVEGAYVIRVGDQHYTTDSGIYTSVTLACNIETCQQLYLLQKDKNGSTKWDYTLVLRASDVAKK